MQQNLSIGEPLNESEVSDAPESSDLNAQDTTALIHSDLLGGDIISSEAKPDASGSQDEVKIIEGGITDITGTVALGGSSDIGGTGHPAATADVGATTGAAGLDSTAGDSGNNTADGDGELLA